MYRSLLVAAALALATAPAARADFVMTGMEPIQAALPQAASGGQDPAASAPGPKVTLTAGGMICRQAKESGTWSPKPSAILKRGFGCVGDAPAF